METQQARIQDFEMKGEFWGWNEIWFRYLRDKKKKKKEGGSEKKGGGWKFTHFTSPGSAPAQFQLKNIMNFLTKFEKRKSEF